MGLKGYFTWLYRPCRPAEVNPSILEMRHATPTMRAIHALSVLAGVNAGTLAPVVDKYCELIGRIAQFGDLHETQMGHIFGNFSALFADKVDCSEVPHDPLIG